MRYEKNSSRILHNENGMALVSALMLGFFGMLLVAALLIMVQSGTWISGSQKRYKMNLDAAHGGMNFFAKEVIDRGLGGTTLSAMGADYGGGLLTQKISNTNFANKLTTTGKTGDGTYPDDTLDAILIFALPSGPNITVDTAIRSTGRGNSGVSSNRLESGGVVDPNLGRSAPQHIPYLYQLEIQAQGAGVGKENARLSAIYAY